MYFMYICTWSGEEGTNTNVAIAGSRKVGRTAAVTTDCKFDAVTRRKS